MDFDSVLYESMDRVATITLNRPERFNAISETMPDDIASAFKHAAKDDSVPCCCADRSRTRILWWL